MIRQINYNEALAELKDMLAWDKHPALEEPQVARLLAGSAQRDVVGIAPSATDWVSTYDLDAAAAEGWRRKAARVAGDYDFQDGESRLDRSQVLEHCMKMVDLYQAKISPGVSMFAFVEDAVDSNALALEINEGFDALRGVWLVP